MGGVGTSTVDSYLTFTTVNDETSSEKMRFDHNGTLFVTKTNFFGNSILKTLILKV